jgi:hypothetical protein
MAINKYPATSPTVAVTVAAGSFSNGAAADQVNVNATNAAAFVLSTNVSLSSGVYNVSASGSLIGRTLSVTTAAGNGTGVYVSTAATQFYTYAPAVWTSRSLTWNTSNSTFNRAITLGYGNGKYLAFPNLGTNFSLKSSTDGITWTTAGAQAIVAQGHIKYLNNLWIATPNISGATNIFTSTDGVTWTSRQSNLGTAQTTGDVAYGNGVYVLTGTASLGLSNVSTSTDGITWTSRTSLLWTSAANINGIVYGAAGFLVNGGSTQVAYNSTDGITWVTRNSSTGGTTIRGLTYANGLYMVVDGNQGTAVSTDTITWTIKTAYSATNPASGASDSTKALVWNSGIYGLIYSNSAVLYASTDGSNWIAKNIGNLSPYAIVYGDKWVAVGDGNVTALASTSTDISGPVTNSGVILWERKATVNGVF